MPLRSAEKVETPGLLRETSCAMIKVPRPFFPAAVPRRDLLLRILLLAVVIASQTGCATSDADLDYTRQTAPDPTQDHSYHGWNNSNY